MLRDAEPEDMESARALFRNWFQRRLDRNFRQLTSDNEGKIDRAAYPDGRPEAAQWQIDKVQGRSKLESQSRFIAQLVQDNDHSHADLDFLSNLIAHGLNELRLNIIPKRRNGDFSDEINDRVVRETFDRVPSGGVTVPVRSVATLSGRSVSG